AAGAATIASEAIAAARIAAAPIVDGGHRNNSATAVTTTTPISTTVSSVRSPGKASIRTDPTVGVAAAVEASPNPNGNRTASSQNAPGLQATNAAITGRATTTAAAANFQARLPQRRMIAAPMNGTSTQA